MRLTVVKLTAFAAVAVALCFSGLNASAQRTGFFKGNTWVPDTSIELPGDAGVRAHTNHLIIVNNGFVNPDAGGSGPGSSMIPSDLRRFYDLSSTGGSGIIAIVDAYDDPYALADFNTFSGLSYIGLPTETSTSVTNSKNKVFQVVYASGRKPSYNSGWSQEEALDIEWAHAMAPNAKIVLFEARSANNTDL